MLTLGQGVFFGLGAYIMAMHLKIADAAAAAATTVPDFMQIAGMRELPALLAAVRLPARRRSWPSWCCRRWSPRCSASACSSAGSRAPTSRSCRQALAAALAILLIGQQTIGGSNGLNSFRTFFGFTLNDPANKQMLFFIAAGVLLRRRSP